MSEQHRGIRRGTAWMLVLAALPLAVTVAPAAAQRNVIVGRVLDHGTGAPLSAVAVSIADSPFRTLTDEAGRFAFIQLEPGTYRLTFSMLGYAERSETVELSGEESAELEVRLGVSPVSLPAIDVTVDVGNITAWLASRGFAKRGLEGNAMLHTDYDGLRISHHRNLEELLRNVAGVRIRTLVDRDQQLLLEPDPRTGEGSCRVGVYLNGSNVEFGQSTWIGNAEAKRRTDPFERATRPMRFSDLLRLDLIDGIELYGPGKKPVAPDSTCGTLLIWSAKMRAAVDEDLTGTVRGTAIDDRSGAVLPGVRVTLDGTGLSTMSDANGSFEIPGVLPGDYRVMADYPDAAKWEAIVKVVAYGNVDLELRLERGRETRDVFDSREASEGAVAQPVAAFSSAFQFSIRSSTATTS
ncbi:MAG: carboxypeptidase regulatory-like domain-containing protein [Gemmatimonadota bacterium]|jgi:hypothetical protein